MVACVSEQALRIRVKNAYYEFFLWYAVQPVPWKSVRQDTSKRGSWERRNIPSRGRKEIQLKKYQAMPFPEQKIAVLRKLYSAVRNGGGENIQREKKIPTLRKSIKNLKAVAFLSLNSGFKWMFSNTINHCSSVQSFICKYAFSNFFFFSHYCLTGSEGR